MEDFEDPYVPVTAVRADKLVSDGQPTSIFAFETRRRRWRRPPTKVSRQQDYRVHLLILTPETTCR